MKKLYFFLTIIFSAYAGHTQGISRIEKILNFKQKWTVMDVKSKTPYFEIGENFTIRVDGKFYHDRNNYAKLGGDWTLNGKELILTYDSFTEERRKIPYIYQIKKWGQNGFQLKYRNRFNKKERVYLK
ncbi:MAG: hypothetical protein GDA51_13260 [Ekhidna sp.]|nr:hypothetical protein [Ekhidna sp.]MBC6410037.1 hypothetical protein [Ekhidna sp.]MBC6427401.1 hypothetical protein [Ekhidna sp.]